MQNRDAKNDKKKKKKRKKEKQSPLFYSCCFAVQYALGITVMK